MNKKRTSNHANLGYTTGRIAPAAGVLEDWNPIGLDFGGHLATTTLAGSNVQFNVDGKAELDARLNGTASAQFQHKTQWLNNTDGFLVLDKNINGSLDNGEELFSNSSVAEPYRGTASLTTWDANADGVINANDPLFNNLLVWKADHYQNRSCLGTNLLGCGTKTYLKTGKNCVKAASSRAKRRKAAQKLASLEIKRGCSPMNICASSYKKKSNLNSKRGSL